MRAPRAQAAPRGQSRRGPHRRARAGRGERHPAPPRVAQPGYQERQLRRLAHEAVARGKGLHGSGALLGDPVPDGHVRHERPRPVADPERLPQRRKLASTLDHREHPAHPAVHEVTKALGRNRKGNHRARCPRHPPEQRPRLGRSALDGRHKGDVRRHSPERSRPKEPPELVQALGFGVGEGERDEGSKTRRHLGEQAPSQLERAKLGLRKHVI